MLLLIPTNVAFTMPLRPAALSVERLHLVSRSGVARKKSNPVAIMYNGSYANYFYLRSNVTISSCI